MKSNEIDRSSFWKLSLIGILLFSIGCGQPHSCTACAVKLANTGDALDDYAQARGGLYPTQIASVIPGFSDSCPCFNEPSYNAGYTVSPDRKTFELCCSIDRGFFQRKRKTSYHLVVPFRRKIIKR